MVACSSDSPCECPCAPQSSAVSQSHSRSPRSCSSRAGGQITSGGPVGHENSKSPRQTKQVTTTAGRTRLARSSAAVAAGTLSSRVTGLIRVGALAWAVGGGTLADVYNLANTAPNIVYELLVGGVLAATIVPIFVRKI